MHNGPFLNRIQDKHFKCLGPVLFPYSSQPRRRTKILSQQRFDEDQGRKWGAEGGEMKVGYARVSTQEQNLDMQIAALEAAGCEEVFVDHGVSGTMASRPGLNKALNHLGEGDTLVVWKLDRLGRSTFHLLTLIEGLEKRGVRFQTLTDHVDTSSPGGRMILRMLAAHAQLERAMISERTREGMKAVRARGVKVGRPRLLTNDQIREVVVLYEEGQHSQNRLPK